ncbi:hemerythrin domain-containing protein [Nitrospira defluvii]|nr:hemerythrin domain-containing protein [Nitrospira defluvii]
MDDRSQVESTASIQSDPIMLLKYEHHMTLLCLETIERTLQYLESLPEDAASERCEIEQTRLREGVLSLEQSMDLHFLKEEEALFPVLAEYIGKNDGPIEVMLNEHNRIRMTLRDLYKSICALSSQTGAKRGLTLKSVTQLGYETIRLIRLHISKENQILFEICEASLSPEEKKDVTKKIKSLCIWFC